MDATISSKPSAPDGERFCVHIGAWNDPDRIYLEGFETCWDAWAFCVCNGMNDPLPSIPGNKRYTLRPPEKKAQQMTMNLKGGE